MLSAITKEGMGVGVWGERGAKMCLCVDYMMEWNDAVRVCVAGFGLTNEPDLMMAGQFVWGCQVARLWRAHGEISYLKAWANIGLHGGREVDNLVSLSFIYHILQFLGQAQWSLLVIPTHTGLWQSRSWNRTVRPVPLNIGGWSCFVRHYNLEYVPRARVVTDKTNPLLGCRIFHFQIMKWFTERRYLPFQNEPDPLFSF